MSEQEFRGEDGICRPMHHLSAAASHRHHTSFAAASTYQWPESYTTNAYVNSSKRQSSPSPSSFQEPVPKRATLHYPSPPCTASAGEGAAVSDETKLLGFTRVPLPHPFPAASAASPPHLYRTVSDPVHLSNVTNPSGPSAQFPEFPFSPSPVSNKPQEIPNLNTAVQDSVQLPSASPVIHRTISDPSPLTNHTAVAAGGTPPHSRRLPQERNDQSYPSCAESPSTKRLKRMKERLKEMNQWWNQVVHEDEEEEDEPENNCTENISKEEQENGEVGNPSQEAVWVEKNGECLVLHFRCPCGTVYQVLLSGNDCYYKLTNF